MPNFVQDHHHQNGSNICFSDENRWLLSAKIKILMESKEINFHNNNNGIMKSEHYFLWEMTTSEEKDLRFDNY